MDFFECLKRSYTKNKTALCVSVTAVVLAFATETENYVLQKVSLVSDEQPIPHPWYRPDNSSCSNFEQERHYKSTNVSSNFFEWTETEKGAVSKIRDFSPIVIMVFAGSYSDRNSAPCAVMIALIMTTVVMSTSYLAFLEDNYVFLVMLGVRRASQGILWVAYVSLAAQMTSFDKRTMFVSILFVGDSLGRIPAYLVSKIPVEWRRASEFAAFLTCVTALWWGLMVCRFPKVRKPKRIPWKGLLTSFSFYSASFLILTLYFNRFVGRNEYHVHEIIIVSFIHFDPQLVIQFILFITSNFGYLFCGALSDFIISEEIASTTAVRRGFIVLSFILTFLTIAMITLEYCHELATLGEAIMLRFIASILVPTTTCSILDFSPPCAGTVAAIATTFALIVKDPLYLQLTNVLVPNYPNGDINEWSRLFFVLAFFSVVTSLPFLCRSFKELSIEIEDSRLKGAKKDAVDLTDIEVHNEEPIQGVTPGTSKP